MVEGILRRVKTGQKDTISFKIPSELIGKFKHEFRQLPEYCIVKIARPRQRRTTGDLSQNHHINGHVSQIAEETGNDFDDVKQEAKLRAIKRGYPFDTLPNGWIIPKSETEIDTIQAGFLIEELHQIAAELGIYLREHES